MNISLTAPFRLRRLVALGILALAASGCVNYSGIGTAMAPRKIDSFETAQTLATQQAGTWPQQQWWRQLQDPQLDALIDAALEHSPTLEDAASRLHLAEAYAGSARAGLYPQVGADFNSQYQRFTENGMIPAPLGGSFDSNNTLELSFSYELDLWGKHSNALKSAVSLQRAAEADHEKTKLVLTSAVAKAYVELDRQYALRDIAAKTLEQRDAIYRLTQQRVNSGLDGRAELKQAESQLPSLRGQLAQIDESIGAARNQLAALIGAGPDRGQQIARPHFGAPIDNVARLPQNLPVDLLGRRPDIVAARWLVEAAERDVDVGKADFYPNINLTAFAGFSSLGLDRLTRSGSEIYGGGPAIRLPLFDAGRLRAQLKMKYSEYESAVANYDKTLTDALHETADQINALRWLEVRQREQQAALAVARDALDLTTQRYEAGLGNYVSVLTAETTVLVQEQLGAELSARALDLHVNLIKALGGGFDAADTAHASAAAATDATAIASTTNTAPTAAQ